MTLELNATHRCDTDGWFVAYVAELTGANSQGETLEEARANLREAVALVVRVHRERADESPG